eukprot:scpid71902/ scgid28744/ 
MTVLACIQLSTNEACALADLAHTTHHDEKGKQKPGHAHASAGHRPSAATRYRSSGLKTVRTLLLAELRVDRCRHITDFRGSAPLPHGQNFNIALQQCWAQDVTAIFDKSARVLVDGIQKIIFDFIGYSRVFKYLIGLEIDGSRQRPTKPRCRRWNPKSPKCSSSSTCLGLQTQTENAV